jgi:hypothetical protein
MEESPVKQDTASCANAEETLAEVTFLNDGATDSASGGIWESVLKYF